MLEVLKYHPRGLVNIGYFYSELEAFITSAPDSGHTHALLYLAIDEPQKLRASVGLQGLDALSKKVASYLRSLMHDNQLITQSTEFVYLLMLRFDSRQQLEENIATLLDELARQSFIVRDAVTHVTASIGAVTLSREFGTVDAAVESAEKASVTASQDGGNQYRVWMQEKVKTAVSASVSEDSLEGVMCEENLRIKYQPIVNIEESENVYEAYARYMNGENILTPEAFMPYVIQHKLQAELNRNVVARVLDDLDESGSYDSAMRRIIVKIEPEENIMMDFLMWLGKRFSQYRGSIRIILSFREEWVLKNKQTFEAFLNLSRKYRFGIAIEHAGMSEYSVELVRAIQPVYTKLSPELTRLLLEGDDKDANNRLSELLASGTRVVASSVENADTFARLMALGIYQFQGYFVQQPESGFNFDFTQQQI
jgi:EAL domain-containing protein (putative c-di-GMP-specific phosphodiesterase class I)/GGDEF domain-containing protein